MLVTPFKQRESKNLYI